MVQPSMELRGEPSKKKRRKEKPDRVPTWPKVLFATAPNWLGVNPKPAKLEAIEPIWEQVTFAFIIPS